MKISGVYYPFDIKKERVSLLNNQIFNTYEDQAFIMDSDFDNNVTGLQQGYESLRSRQLSKRQEMPEYQVSYSPNRLPTAPSSIGNFSTT